jgi:hypothetical protein
MLLLARHDPTDAGVAGGLGRRVPWTFEKVRDRGDRRLGHRPRLLVERPRRRPWHRQRFLVAEVASKNGAGRQVLGKPVDRS